MNCRSLSPATCPIPLVRVPTANVLFPMLFYATIFHALCLMLTRGVDKLPWENGTLSASQFIDFKKVATVFWL